MNGTTKLTRLTGLKGPAGLGRGLLALLVGALTVLGLGACSGVPQTPLPASSSAGSAGSAAPSATPSGTASAAACTDALQSYPPGPAGSAVDAIRSRGRLIVGVSADTYLLGARNPVTGTIEGFDIDLARAVAQAITGSADKIEFKVISAADRIPALKEGRVDLVARNFTINCARWQDIAFSAEYYRSGQKLLARKDSTVKSVSDLAGQKVCAPKGTSTLDTIRRLAPKAVITPADTHTGCLVLFQSGAVDVITGDDTVLAGLAAQDPYAVVLPGAALSAEPYGLGIKKENVDLVRFVNQTLAEYEKDGRWTASYNRWLAPSLGKAPNPPAPQYGRG